MSAQAAEAMDECRVVVVYEDGSARDRAMELAARMEDQIGNELSFVFNSWNFKELADPTMSHMAS